MVTKTIIKEKAVEIVDLVNLVGTANVAKMFAVSQNSVSEMVRLGKCRPIYNRAAAGELSKRQVKKEAEMLYFVKVPRDKREVFEAFTSGMGFKYRTFTDE